MSDKPDKTKTKKAEYPLNRRGMGYRSTLENGPYFKDDVQYVEPDSNYNYSYCGACAFYRSGNCMALEEDVDIIGSCDLYISMANELSLEFESFILQQMYANKSADETDETDEELEVAEEVEKYISKENGKYCVRSHQTNKNFGCYDTKAQAEKRLRQISRFKSTEFQVKFASMDEDKKIVYGIVLEPDEIDAHGDTITKDEIEKAAHLYLKSSRVIGDGHTKKAKAYPIESFIYTPEILKKVKEGSWVMAIKVSSDSIWQSIKDGDYQGLSIGALVVRKPLKDEG